MEEDNLSFPPPTSAPAIPPTPEPVLMVNQTPVKSKKSLVIILSVLLVISVALAGLFYFQFQKLSKELSKYQTQPSPTPATKSNPTSNWKTYQNEKYGFEIKYPPDFTEQIAESDMTLLQITKTDRGNLYNFGVRVIKNYEIDQILSKVEKIKEINIKDRLGYEYFYTEGAGMSEVALIQLGKDVLNINFDSIGDDQNFTSPEDRKIYVQDFFDQILSTFKFLETTSLNNEGLTKEECTRQGGLWRKWGLLGQEYCQIPVSDGGKSCTDGSQCSLGNCIATTGTVPGKCQTYKATFGCIKFINNGVVDQKALCVD